MKRKLGSKDKVTITLTNVKTNQEKLFIIEKNRRTQVVRGRKPPKAALKKKVIPDVKTGVDLKGRSK